MFYDSDIGISVLPYPPLLLLYVVIKQQKIKPISIVPRHKQTVKNLIMPDM